MAGLKVGCRVFIDCGSKSKRELVRGVVVGFKENGCVNVKLDNGKLVQAPRHEVAPADVVESRCPVLKMMNSLLSSIRVSTTEMNSVESLTKRFPLTPKGDLEMFSEVKAFTAAMKMLKLLTKTMNGEMSAPCCLKDGSVYSTRGVVAGEYVTGMPCDAWIWTPSEPGNDHYFDCTNKDRRRMREILLPPGMGARLRLYGNPDEVLSTHWLGHMVKNGTSKNILDHLHDADQTAEFFTSSASASNLQLQGCFFVATRDIEPGEELLSYYSVDELVDRAYFSFPERKKFNQLQRRRQDISAPLLATSVPVLYAAPAPSPSRSSKDADEAALLTAIAQQNEDARLCRQQRRAGGSLAATTVRIPVEEVRVPNLDPPPLQAVASVGKRKKTNNHREAARLRRQEARRVDEISDWLRHSKPAWEAARRMDTAVMENAVPEMERMAVRAAAAAAARAKSEVRVVRKMAQKLAAQDLLI